MTTTAHCTTCNAELKFYEVADGICCGCQIEQPVQLPVQSTQIAYALWSVYGKTN